MRKLECIKEAICIKYGIKNRKKVKEKLNILAIDMLKRKEIQTREFQKENKNLSKDYCDITKKIFKSIEEIKTLI